MIMIWNYLLIEIKLMLRYKTRLALSILLPLAFYLLFTSIIDVPQQEKAEFNKMYMYSMTTFSLTSFCLFSFPLEIIDERKRGWYKNLIRTPLKKSYYITVKILKVMIQFAIAIIIIFTVAALFKNVHMPYLEWIVSGLLLWIGASLFLTMGSLLSQLNDLQKASGIGNILYIVLAVIGGLWMPIDQFPVWMRPISDVMPTYHLKRLAIEGSENLLATTTSLSILMLYSMVFLCITLYIHKRRDVVS